MRPFMTVGKNLREPTRLPVDSPIGDGYEKDAHHGGSVPVLSGSLPARRFRVNHISGRPSNYYGFVRDGLSANTYTDKAGIWSGQRSGWASIDNYLNADASQEALVAEYAVFSLRIDTRTASAPRVRALLDKAVAAWKQEHGAKHVPRDVKHELRENVTNEVLSETTPRTKIIDVVWDTTNDWLILSHLSEGVLEAFMRNFGASFPGIGLEAWDPFGSEDELIADVERTAGDFYLWLWWSISTGEAVDGVENLDVDGKVVLSGKGGETTVSSEAIHQVPEAHVALLNGKRPTMMKLRADIDGRTFAFSVTGCRAFFATLKLPDSGEKKTRLDREAAIIDRMGAYGLLHDTFSGWIRQFRTMYNDPSTWPEVSESINNWLKE
jgi:hypothetical protein